uniref:EF-hand domain-containing protein n=1 Tax=Ciona savignyi TaxID=51511 RepID=H2Z5F8_CIOSA
EKAIRTLGATGLKIFKEYDLDKDMKLDAAEFKHLYEYILCDLQETDEVYDENTDEVLMLTAEMEPLVLSSMSQTNKNPAFGTPLFTGLVAWKKPRKPEIELFAKEFKIFLPPNSSQMIGDAYWVVEKPTNIEELTGNRYRSPLPKTKAEKLLHKLMSMFHSRPFVTMRFSPHGGAAVIRAQNSVYLDISFRIHSEFQLNEPPNLPYWFTPAQFAGSITIARDGSHVRDFQLYVPNTKKLNVDMEWETEDPNAPDNHMEVDIGYLPLMRINQRTPSSPLMLANSDGSAIDRRELRRKGKDIEVEFDQIEWSDSITEPSAASQLEKLFFPFKQVDYLPFNEAFDRAKTEKKLVHQVLLWGALDDQSC